MKPIIVKAKDTSSYGRIEEAYDSQKVKETTELQIDGIVRDKTIGLLMLAVFGALNTSGSTIYTHAFTLANTNTHTTFSLWGVTSVATYSSTYAMLDELTLTCEAGDYVKYSAMFKGKKMVSDTPPAVSFLTDNEFLGKHVTLKFADTEGGLAGATAVEVERVELTINKNLLDFQALGSDDIDSIYNQQFTIAGNFEAVFENETFLDYVLDDSKKFMLLSIINTDVDYDSADYPTITFTFGKVSFDEWDKSTDNNGIVKQTIGFEAQFNNAEGYLIEGSLQNQVASY